MTIQFKDETFRDDYTFKNSEWAVKRFPFPFHEDSYMYSVNMEQHKGDQRVQFMKKDLMLMNTTYLKCVTAQKF